MNLENTNIENAFRSFIKNALAFLSPEQRQEAYQRLIDILIELQESSE